MSNDTSPWTPGPWRIYDYGDSYEVLVIHRDSENRICFMATPGSSGDPVMIAANARLIAAAPDMANALKGAMHALKSYQYGNAAPDLAEEIAEHIGAILAHIGAS